jgi:catechol 2,3-dioxygenase-like lactoylglutathione lyase family enzyme
MKPKISIVTLCVEDVERSIRFYRDGLGLPPHHYEEGDEYVMFRCDGAFLALHPLATALDAPPDRRQPPFHGVSVSHNEPSPEGVRAVYAEAIAAGATPKISPREAPWGGYEACFADPDGHLWDIAYNPFTDLT